MKANNKEPTGITTSQKLQSMYDSDFTGWTEDAKNGYLTAVITLIEIIKEPIVLTVNESMEQAADKYTTGLPTWADMEDVDSCLKDFKAGWQANNSYNKAIEDATAIVKKLFDALPEPDTNENKAFYSLLNTIIEQLKQLQK